MSSVTHADAPFLLLSVVLLVTHLVAWVATRRWRWSDVGAPPLSLASMPGPDSSPVRCVLAVLLVTAFAFRLPGLNEGLWFDELQTWVRYARRPFVEILTSFESRNQHMLYSLSAHASLLLFGDHGWALRLPAVGFGVGSLWALFRFMRHIARADEALVAVALLGFSYQHVWFSQNARGYTGLLFGSLVGGELLVRMLSARTDGARVAWQYGVVMALAVYMHATAAFVVVAHLLVWAIAWWRCPATPAPSAVRLPALGFVLVLTMTTMLYGPVMSQVTRTVRPARMLVTAQDLQPQPERVEPIAPPTYMSDEARGIDRGWRRLEWLVREVQQRLMSPQGGTAGLLAAAVLPVVVGLWVLLRHSPGFLAVVVMPGLITFLALFVSDQVLFPRFFFFTIGSVVLLFVHGVYAMVIRIAGAPRRWLATGLLALAALAQIPGARRAWEPKQRFAAARDYVHAHAGPQDAVATVAMTRLPYIEYFGEPWSEVETGLQLRELAAAHTRTWVVSTMPANVQRRHPDVWAELQSSFEAAAEFPATVGDGEITVFVRRNGRE